jgi:hypothetical protein
VLFIQSMKLFLLKVQHHGVERMLSGLPTLYSII